MSADEGWYAVARGITDHHLFKGHPERFFVWMWLLDNVTWKETTHDIRGRTVIVPRGSICVSTRHIATQCKVGHQVVRTAIDRFIRERMVNTSSTHGKTIITICNYEKYQGLGSDDSTAPNTPVTHQQHTANTQKEQGNKGTTTEGDKSPSPAKRAKRLSEDWVLPMDWGRWAVDEGWPEDVIRREAEKFKDYWLAKSGRDAAKLSWERTWRNWMRNVAKRSTPSQQRTQGHDAVALSDRVAARFTEMDSGPGPDDVVSLFPPERFPRNHGGGFG